jgi:hypothetical protein
VLSELERTVIERDDDAVIATAIRAAGCVSDCCK